MFVSWGSWRVDAMDRAGYPKLMALGNLFHRAFYTALWLKQRSTLGAQIALFDGTKVLLVRHTYKPGWHLPGGGVEPPEDPHETAIRELLEETGYRIASSPELLGILPNPSPATRTDYIALYGSTEFTLQASPSSSEIAELAWHQIDALPDSTTSFCRNAVSLALRMGQEPASS